MNWIAVAYVVLGLLAFPLCVIGITVLAGGMLVAGRIMPVEGRRTHRLASLKGGFGDEGRVMDETHAQGRAPS